MAIRRSVLFYSAMLLLFGAGIYVILGYGSRMAPVAAVAAVAESAAVSGSSHSRC